MTIIPLPALNDLDQDLVDQLVSETVTLVQEHNPKLQLNYGNIRDLVIRLHAVLAGALQTNLQAYLDARSLLVINANPSLAKPELVDDVLSNFRVTRLAGAPARGDVALVRDTDASLTLAVGTVFVGNGQQFVTTQVFNAKAEASQINDSTDRLITRTADGRYTFTITVVAAVDGAAGLLRRNTALVPQILPLGFVKAYAVDDFVDGRDTETNDALLLRMAQGVATKALSGRTAMQAALLEQTAFQNVRQNSIIGYGDGEMRRDRHWIWPVAGGGRCDWYIRTGREVFHKQLTKTATLIAKDTVTGHGTWQFSLARDESPGFYEVSAVRIAGSTETGTFTLVSDTRGLDLTGSAFVPDLADAGEAVYSAFQTATIRFVDTLTDTTALALGATARYDVETRGQDLIADLQAYVSDRGVRHFGADCLVRAPVPCFVQLSLTITKKSTEAAPDVTAIKEDLAAAVNGIDFVGQLNASKLYDVIHNHLQNDTVVSGLDMLGRLRRPDGATTWLRSGEVLLVPAEPEQLVSYRTVQFFCAPADIAITVVSGLPTGR